MRRSGLVLAVLAGGCSFRLGPPVHNPQPWRDQAGAARCTTSRAAPRTDLAVATAGIALTGVGAGVLTIAALDPGVAHRGLEALIGAAAVAGGVALAVPYTRAAGYGRRVADACERERAKPLGPTTAELISLAEALLIEGSQDGEISLYADVTSPRFPSTVLPAGFLDRMGAIRRQLGGFRRTLAVEGVHLAGPPDARTAHLALRVEYQRGRARAVLDLRWDDGTWRMTAVDVTLIPGG